MVGHKSNRVYVESSHANNTGCAKFVNDCLYDTKTPMQLDNENCRTAINGFPIEVYMNGEYLGKIILLPYTVMYIENNFNC